MHNAARFDYRAMAGTVDRKGAVMEDTKCAQAVMRKSGRTANSISKAPIARGKVDGALIRESRAAKRAARKTAPRNVRTLRDGIAACEAERLPRHRPRRYR